MKKIYLVLLLMVAIGTTVRSENSKQVLPILENEVNCSFEILEKGSVEFCCELIPPIKRPRPLPPIKP